jgi:transglutaminase-like putative cysteine protease
MKEPGSLEIGADLSFTTDGAAQKSGIETLTPEERELYLRPAEGLIRVSPRIADLAATFAGADTSLEVALNAWDFLLDELSCGMVRYDQVNPQTPGDWVLDNGWYDCQLGSSLFIAICRARGIPARLASGYMLYDLAPGYHYWSEIWQDGRGWLPFDLLCWDLSGGGRDIPWRTHFAGAVDYRMVTQCLPLSFTGPMSIRFPPAWHLLNAPLDRGMTVHFIALDGEPIYSDQVVIGSN